MGSTIIEGFDGLTVVCGTCGWRSEPINDNASADECRKDHERQHANVT